MGKASAIQTSTQYAQSQLRTEPQCHYDGIGIACEHEFWKALARPSGVLRCVGLAALRSSWGGRGPINGERPNRRSGACAVAPIHLNDFDMILDLLVHLSFCVICGCCICYVGWCFEGALCPQWLQFLFTCCLRWLIWAGAQWELLRFLMLCMLLYMCTYVCMIPSRHSGHSSLVAVS